MSKKTKSLRTQNYFELASVLSLALVYPVLSMFWHHKYPILSTEFFLLIGASLALSQLMAALLFKARDWIINFALVLVIFIVFMIQFNLLLEGMAYALLGLIIFVLISGKYSVKLLGPTLLAVILGSYLDSRIDRATNENVAEVEYVDKSLPPVIHIVMDQFIGLDGLPPQSPAQLFRNTAMEFLQDYQFQVYPRAYSNYVTTQDSLDHAFNFQNGTQATKKIDLLLLKNYRFKANNYLKSLNDSGYAIRIYQSEGMNFCSAVEQGLEKCWTYNIPDLISIYHGYEDPLERMRIVFRLLISQSWILNMIAEQHGFSRPGGLSYFKPDIFKEIANDVRSTGANGRVFFAHILFPHTPYVYLGDCSLNYSGEKQWRFSGALSDPQNTPQSRGNRYITYLEQARCSLKQLATFFEELRAQGIFDQSIILLHSDHGSTIYERQPSLINEPNLTQSDLLDAFSILYALKMPNESFRIHPDPISLSLLIHQLAAALTGKTYSELDENPFIYLGSEKKLLRRNIDIFSHEAE
jgi:hypothetical protein